MGRRRRLTPEDRALWEKVAQSARPLRPTPGPPSEAVPAPPPGPPLPAPFALSPTEPPALRPAIIRPEGRLAAGVSWTAFGDDRPGPVGRTAPGLDRNTARRLARGRREPEARLDLHGMTADRAHGALTRFVLDSAAAGRRCVLVVTGKGRGEGGARGEGVLRRETPRWLGVPPLAPLVVGVYEAHARHGGAGALYVYLKKRRG